MTPPLHQDKLRVEWKRRWEIVERLVMLPTLSLLTTICHFYVVSDLSLSPVNLEIKERKKRPLCSDVV